MILARVKIGEFDQFWNTFTTRGAAKRAEHGSQGAQVFRNSDDANEILVLFDWDREGYEAFKEDPEVPQIFQEAGLQSPPDAVYLESAGEHGS